MRDTKRSWHNRIPMLFMLLLATAVLVVAAVLAVALLRYDAATHPQGELHPIAIEGVYSEEGGPWTPLTDTTTFQNLTLRDITLRGHFTRAIPEGENLYLNLDHMRVSLRVNGQELYRLAPERGNGNLTQAMGKQYVTIVSPGITTEDTVELNFGNLYRNAYIIQFDELLHQMHTGSERMMFFEAVRTDAWTLGIGILLLFLTLFLIFPAAYCAHLHIPGGLQFLWLGLLALTSSLWFLTLSPALAFIFPRPVFLNVLYALSTQCMVIFFVLLVISNLSGWRRQLMTAVEGVLLLVLLVGLINQLLGIQDLYSAINYASLFDIAAVLCTGLCLWYEAYRLKRAAIIAMLKALILLLIGGVLELLNGYIQFAEASIMLGIGLIAFAVLEGISLLRRIKRSLEREKEVVRLELELEKNRTSSMLSQIQPHFLYNALQGIKQLCDTDPPQASEALEHFSYYLRGNLDALTSDFLITFEKELVHIKDYLYLEKMRFRNKLNIVWELDCTDFFIPPLTVQPMVENAIRHGITKKKGGGTLTIQTAQRHDAFVITISDDGVGFQPTEQTQKTDGRSHIGIENTRARLQLLCGGSLGIESQEGVGTRVELILPKRSPRDENHCGG